MILITGDWHLDENNLNDYRWKIFDTIYDLINKYSIDTLIFLGDLTERKDRHGSDFVNKIIKFFVDISNYIKIIFICGNHDRLNQNSIPFFKFIKYLPVTFVDDYLILENCIFISYKKETEVKELLKQINNIDFVFMHQQIDDLVGFKSETGLLSSDFNKFKKVFSGHIHGFFEHNNIMYVGSPHPVDFGEPSGLLIVTNNNFDKIEKIKIPSITKHNLDIYSIDELMKIDFKEYDQVKLKVKINKNDLTKSHIISEEINKFLNERSVKLVSLSFIIEDTDNEKQISLDIDDFSVVESFCQKENITDKFLIDIAREIISMEKEKYEN